MVSEEVKTAGVIVILCCVLASCGLRYRPTQIAEVVPQALALCTVLAEMNRLAGTTVVVSAEVWINDELSVALDERCLRKGAARDATFEYWGREPTTPLDRRLTNRIRSDGAANVVVRARVEDPGTYIGHLSCCRYRLIVEEVLAVRRATGRDRSKAANER
jgi:hypothetical protein